MADAQTALVAGCGSIGSRHARNLRSLGVDISLFDVDSDRSEKLARELDAVAYQSMEEALDHDPEVTVIATPSHHHIRPALDAVESGCDIFVEKPLSNDLGGVERLLQAVNDKDAISMIGCNLRFHPAIRRIKTLLDEGRIGNVVSARIEGGSYLPEWHAEGDYRDMYSAKAGVGGALFDYIHELNYARFFFGEPVSVSGMLGEASNLEIETEDTASLIARFESGVICHVHADYIQRPYSRSCHIVGEEGTIRWQWDDPTVRRYDVDGETWRTECRLPDWEMNEMYMDMMEHFLESVDTGTEPTSTLTDGWRDLAFALGAKESNEADSHITL